jgi:hypothetical protein
MVILKVRVIALAHHAQASRNSALAGGKNRSRQQSLSMFPDRLGKEGLKPYDQKQQLDRQCLHRRPPWKVVFSLRGLSLLFQKPKMDKVELSNDLKTARV